MSEFEIELEEEPPLDVEFRDVLVTGSGEPIPGPQGPPGPRGSIWFFGNGEPNEPDAVNGDYYLDVTTGDVYRKD